MRRVTALRSLFELIDLPGDSVDLSLLLVSPTLRVLGYSAYAQRGAKVWVRLLGAFGTMLFGFVVFVLNYAVH